MSVILQEPLPVKPLRLKDKTKSRPDLLKWLPLKDAESVRLAWLIAVGMVIIIAGTVVIGKSFAIMSIVPFALCILAVATRDQMTAIAIYSGYSAMEGMYKYLSNFSQGVYAVAPVLMGAIAIAWGLSRRSRTITSDPPPFFGILALFSFNAILAIFNPYGAGIFEGFVTCFLWYIGPLLMYFIACSQVRKTQQVIGFYLALLALSTVVSGFGIVQYVKGEAWTTSHLPGYGDARNAGWWYYDEKGRIQSGTFRPASTTPLGGGGSSYSYLGLVIAVGLVLVPGTSSRRRLLLLATIPLNGVALLIFGVRLYGILATLTITGTLILNARSVQEILRAAGLAILASVLAVVAIIIASNLTDGKIIKRFDTTFQNPIGRFTKERGSNFTTVFDIISHYPFGAGYQRGFTKGQYRQGVILINRETQFAAIQSDMGIVGLILLIAFSLGFLTKGWQVYRATTDVRLRPLSAMIYNLLLGNIIGYMAGPVLQTNVPLWITAGILMTIPLIEKREKEELAAENTRLLESTQTPPVLTTA